MIHHQIALQFTIDKLRLSIYATIESPLLDTKTQFFTDSVTFNLEHFLFRILMMLYYK